VFALVSLVTASPAVRNRFELSTAAVGVVSSVLRGVAAAAGLSASWHSARTEVQQLLGLLRATGVRSWPVSWQLRI